jgi:preprotein translocase subunit SecA
VAPAFLNALTERGVQIVTVNDYLAERDAREMGPVFDFLGVSVACVVHETEPAARFAAYRRGVTYTTNKELGFDFLRDEEAVRAAPWFEHGRGVEEFGRQRRQRGDWHFAIVDEADSVLIDDARTPLILADAPGVDEEAADVCRQADNLAVRLEPGVHFRSQPRDRKIDWLPAGRSAVTQALGGRRSPAGVRVDWHEACLRAVKAHRLFRRDVDYIVEGDEVVIVDENTGRRMPGRQWEDGLHQAVTCKEGLPILGRSRTLAKTTYQRYFNRYEKLAGMSGTMMPAASEIARVYGAGTAAIPPNKPCMRRMLPDRIFATEAEKWTAVAVQIAELHARGQPVLAGTRSIEKSELLSKLLDESQVPHIVLNARRESEEAEIVARAGVFGGVTVATNMAGRGTDIKLTADALAVGGLFVLATERHESRRVDLQLVGRCARQGDPGVAQFFLSLEDALLVRHRPLLAERLRVRFASSTGPLPAWVARRFGAVQVAVERRHRRERMKLVRDERRARRDDRLLGVE